MDASRPAPSAEWSLLRAACSQSTGAQRTVGELLASPVQSSPVEWKIVVALAEKHGVLPLLAQTLANASEGVPPDILQTLRQAYQTNLHKALFLSRELIRILDRLSSAGIVVMPYKGLALAESLYGDIALRQSGDIDLLIRAADLARIRGAVGELGYAPHVTFSKAEEEAYLKSGYECAFDGAAGRNLLEVQWAIQPRFYAVEVEMEGLFRRAVNVTVAGCAMKTPSPEDLFLILALHAAKHVWGRLIWVCDLARLSALPSMNWKWIGGQAEELGVTRILRVSLILSERLLDRPIPAGANAYIPQDSIASGLADEIVRCLAQDVTFNVESLAYFRWMVRLREQRADQIRFVSRLIFTPGPGEWSVVRLPKPLFPLYRLVRISRLAARVVQKRV